MSPRTKEQFEAIREEKKTHIMDVALEHFAREGYYKTTITHLARHAGMSKGLMYNYFKSKEELLNEIIYRSVSEISAHFDPDRDGILTEDEFELFVRKYFMVIREKIVFWRLLTQLMLQKDVREHLLRSKVTSSIGYPDEPTDFGDGILKTIMDYFQRKASKKSDDYDALIDLNMFLCTMKGFAMRTIYYDPIDEEKYDKTIDRIIELYK